MTRILVVDDEPQILRALRVNLLARSYDVLTASADRQALDAAAREHPDLIVLDLGLPDMDGVDVILELRRWTPVPILILSGRLNSKEKIRALDAGADDSVTKPFNVDELAARVRAVTRRHGGVELAPMVALGSVNVDLAHRRVTRPASDGKSDRTDLRLTRTEWHLLEILLRNPAGSSPNANSSATSAGRTTPTSPTTHASTWPSCAASSKKIRPAPGTCSPSQEWATATSRRRTDLGAWLPPRRLPHNPIAGSRPSTRRVRHPGAAILTELRRTGERAQRPECAEADRPGHPPSIAGAGATRRSGPRLRLWRARST